MGSGKIRSTRKLCQWMVEQVSSGRYPGLTWDNEAKTMFRIPWKHAGKQDFRSDEDAAIFKAWAEFKGKLKKGSQEDPASWKTRLRCALNKSPEFEEVPERSQLDISEPYKVYRLVPLKEQGVVTSESKGKENQTKKRLKRKGSKTDDEDYEPKKMKEEVVTSPRNLEDMLGNVLTAEQDQLPFSLQNVEEIELNVHIETAPCLPGVLSQSPSLDEDSFHIMVKYLGQEVLQRVVPGNDVRIAYQPSLPIPPTSTHLMGGFPRINLPEPPSTLSSSAEHSAQHQALSTLLPYMEKGVMLTSSPLGVYARRFCRGRVFWTGPHTTTPELHKMERNMDPVLLFNKTTFSQQLEHYRMNGGDPPSCSITMCFGEELMDTDDTSSKLIIAEISLPWAQQQVQEAIMEPIRTLYTLASQSPQGEITLNLVSVPLEALES